MKEITGDLWDFHDAGEWIAITTNGDVNKRGDAVMGRGVALQAKQRYPHLPRELAHCLVQKDGNLPHVFRDLRIITFPVKHHWFNAADFDLIKQSAWLIWDLMEDLDDPPEVLYLPRPGCGNGGLSWDDVQPILEPIFDDRFVVVSLPT